METKAFLNSHTQASYLIYSFIQLFGLNIAFMSLQPKPGSIELDPVQRKITNRKS